MTRVVEYVYYTNRLLPPTKKKKGYSPKVRIQNFVFGVYRMAFQYSVKIRGKVCSYKIKHSLLFFQQSLFSDLNIIDGINNIISYKRMLD